MFGKLWNRLMSPVAILFVGMAIGAQGTTGQSAPLYPALLVTLLVLFVIFAWVHRHMTVEEAQDPKAPLASGKWTVITVVERYHDGYLLALRQHVDWGKWRYRLADIPHGILIGPVVRGDEIVAVRRGLTYEVQLA